MLASDEKNLTKTLASEMTRFRHYLIDRKSTRLNSSHSQISYAVFCLKKKKKNVCKNRLKKMYRLRATDAPRISLPAQLNIDSRLSVACLTDKRTLDTSELPTILRTST